MDKAVITVHPEERGINRTIWFCLILYNATNRMGKVYQYHNIDRCFSVECLSEQQMLEPK